MKYIILVIISVFSFSLVNSQNIELKGIVKDKTSKQELSGATIVIKELNKGVSTDLDGRFKIAINKSLNKKLTLTVSYIGFKTKTILVENKTYFEIELEEDTTDLDEVIITSSYGTKKLKEEVVGSIVSIKPEEAIKEQAVTSFDELLEGQVAGLNIEINPELGERVRIDIRGQGSLTPLNANAVGTSTQPLIIIDGIIMSEEVGIDGSNFFDEGTGNLSENLLNSLTRIGVQDIEDINVLKDAAAVGLYGADAANGVILITTKSGSIGKLKFNVSAQTGINRAFNQFKYLNGSQYQQILNTYNFNRGNLDDIQEWNGVNTNWFDLLNRTGQFYNVNVGLSAGNEKFTYRTNIGVQHIKEAQINNDLTRITSSFALDFKANKFNASLRFSPSYVIKNNPNTLYNFAVPPTLAPFDENGNYSPFPSFGNPLAVANQNKAESTTLGILNSLTLQYKFSNSLSLSSTIGVDFSKKDEDRFFSGLNGTGQFNDGDLGRRIIRDRENFRWNFNTVLNFNKVFKETHSTSGVFGLEVRNENVDLSFQRGDNFNNFATPQPLSSAEEIDFRADSSISKGLSLFSQLSYDYKKRYFLLANFRVDKSSAFGSDNNTAINSGFGASWNISNEPFFENVKFIDFLRLRTSYGATGNSRIGSYRALGLYSVLLNSYNAQTAANLSSLPNPNLGWETNLKFNLGLDVNLFNNKVNLTLEYFRDTIKDMIVSRNAIPEVGLTNVQINGAEMYNRGLELSLNFKWFNTEDFSWNTSLNYSRIRNKVTALRGLGTQFSSAERARSQQVGFPTSTFWGFKFEGIDPATGTELYNVDGEIYDIAYLEDNFDQSDWEPIGDSQPDFFGGINNNFKYKNFGLRMVFTYSYGQDILLPKEVLDNYNVLVNRNISVNVFEDAWQQQGQIASLPALTSNRRILSNSSKYVFDTSHIRLRTVQFSYDVATEKLPVDTLSFFVNGTNLWYWFKNPSPNGKNGVAEYRNTYPEMRTFTLGLNASF